MREQLQAAGTNKAITCVLCFVSVSWRWLPIAKWRVAGWAGKVNQKFANEVAHSQSLQCTFCQMSITLFFTDLRCDLAFGGCLWLVLVLVLWNQMEKTKKMFTLLDLCVSSLRRGHANLLCIVPILSDDPRRASTQTHTNTHTHTHTHTPTWAAHLNTHVHS